MRRRMHELIVDFQRKSLEEIVNLEWVQEAFRALYRGHLEWIEIIRQNAQSSDGTIFFDVSGYEMEGYNKFIPYYLFPEATYCIGISMSSYRSKISVGSNPWSPRRARTTLPRSVRDMAAGDIR